MNLVFLGSDNYFAVFGVSGTVFNRNHQPMPSGGGLDGHASTTQTLILPALPQATLQLFADYLGRGWVVWGVVLLVTVIGVAPLCASTPCVCGTRTPQSQT